MINEDELAIAFLAKSAANELHTIDQFTTQNSSSGPANRLNPVSFIPSIQRTQTNNNVVNQQAIIDQLNREAAMAYPLPPPPPPLVSAPALPLLEGEANISRNKGEIDSNVITILEKLSTNLIDINETLKTIVTTLQKT